MRQCVFAGMLLTALISMAQPASAGPINFKNDAKTTGSDWWEHESGFVGRRLEASSFSFGRHWDLSSPHWRGVPDVTAPGFHHAEFGPVSLRRIPGFDLGRLRHPGHPGFQGGDHHAPGGATRGVPEPSSLLLVALGLAGAAAVRRRRAARA